MSNERTFWVAADEIYPAYEFHEDERQHLPAYRLPEELIAEYQRLRVRLEKIGNELVSHALRTGQMEPGQDNLQRIILRDVEEERALLDAKYCPACQHPWSYHGEDGCSMPVTPGTHLPITRGSDARERCDCRELQPK